MFRNIILSITNGARYLFLKVSLFGADKIHVKNPVANPEHIKWLREGVESWNNRRKQEHFRPDLNGANIPHELKGSSYRERHPYYFSLKGIDLSHGNFRNVYLGGLNLREVNLNRAKLQEANLWKTDLRGAQLIGADLNKAVLTAAKLSNADAVEANFTGADLRGADLRGTHFFHANFSHANLGEAKIKDVDFSQATLIGADISDTQFWESFLYRKTQTKKGTRYLSKAKRIKSIGHLLNRWRLLKNHYGNEDHLFYFRGEYSNSRSWELRPSIMRSWSQKGFVFRNEEDKMLLDLISRRPEDFIGATSAISQLVVAQQHGLKTRLLDITRNPLVALFHACDEEGYQNSDDYSKTGNSLIDGVLHVFVVPKDLVKAFNSDTISVIANLAKLSRSEQDIIMGKLAKHTDSDRKYITEYPSYSSIMNRLYHFIGQEEPYFKERIDVRDLFRVFVVEPQQSFERIRAQSGAFFISAFHEQFERKKILSWNKNIPIYDYYKLIVPAESKSDILDELQFLNVTREILFPGLDEVAEAIVDQYKNNS